MKSERTLVILSCAIVVAFLPTTSSQGTGKVQEFFKKYFGEYFPKTTRSYTLYGNGLNGPADFNAGLPVAEDAEGVIKNIIIRRQSQKNAQPGPNPQFPQVPAQENSWQPTNFYPVAFETGGHRGRSDLTAEFDEPESRIITAENADQFMGDDTREFRMESSMSFSSPGTVSSEPVQ